jgi:hypothetical protein
MRESGGADEFVALFISLAARNFLTVLAVSITKSGV